MILQILVGPGWGDYVRTFLSLSPLSCTSLLGHVSTITFVFLSIWLLVCTCVLLHMLRTTYVVMWAPTSIMRLMLVYLGPLVCMFPLLMSVVVASSATVLRLVLVAGRLSVYSEALHRLKVRERRVEARPVEELTIVVGIGTPPIALHRCAALVAFPSVELP